MKKLLTVSKVQRVVLDWMNEMNEQYATPDGRYYIETEDVARLFDLIEKAWWEEFESYKGSK